MDTNRFPISTGKAEASVSEGRSIWHARQVIKLMFESRTWVSNHGERLLPDGIEMIAKYKKQYGFLFIARPNLMFFALVWIAKI